jgi:hypothetical protein
MLPRPIPAQSRTDAESGAPAWRRLGLIVLGALLAFAAVDGALFRTPLYARVLDPASGAGSFEWALAQLQARPPDPRHDVLVLGDSRIYDALDPKAAGGASGLHFLDAAVPGTTPRCWYFFMKALDPRADRYRALVIPVDTYSDDDGAIGSIDGNNRPFDLRYIVLHVGLRDTLKLARSFGSPRWKATIFLDALLRAPEMREDVQELLADPAARAAARSKALLDHAEDPRAAHPAEGSLAGMRVDFARNRIDYPPGVSPAERVEMERQVLRVAHPSPSYAIYRRDWLEPIVARYRAAGTPVIFVRIPTRPAHRALPPPPTGTLLDFARRYGATLVAQDAYVALERPDLFADHDHLSASGSARFNRLLGADVARALR